MLYLAVVESLVTPGRSIDKFGRVLSDLKTLLPVRDQVIDWILLEGQLGQDSSLSSMLIDFLERLLAMSYRPDDMQSWNEWWFESSRILVLELFLYTVAALVKLGKAAVLRDLLSASYLRPETRLGRESFSSFSDFYTYSEVLDRRKARLSLNRISLLADVLKERGTRSDIPFREIIQADLLLHFYSCINAVEWYPQTVVYAEYHADFLSLLEQSNIGTLSF